MRKCIVCGKDMTGAYPTKQICSPECKKIRQAQLAPSYYEQRKKVRDAEKKQADRMCTRCNERPVKKGNYFFCSVCFKSVNEMSRRVDGNYAYDSAMVTGSIRRSSNGINP